MGFWNHAGRYANPVKTTLATAGRHSVAVRTIPGKPLASSRTTVIAICKTPRNPPCSSRTISQRGTQPRKGRFLDSVPYHRHKSRSTTLKNQPSVKTHNPVVRYGTPYPPPIGFRTTAEWYGKAVNRYSALLYHERPAAIDHQQPRTPPSASILQPTTPIWAVRP